MKYLFFDIECANCFNGQGKICSFGYVLVDEFFQIIEQSDIIINPKQKFHLRNRRDGGEDIELGYPLERFLEAPDFEFYYEKIAKLLESDNQVLFGHSVNNDLRFLMSECKRYSKPYFNVLSYDSQILYKFFSKEPLESGLKKICEKYNIPFTDIHRSDYDAYLTMQVIKSLCAEYKTSIEGLLELCPNASYTAQDGKIANNFTTKNNSKRVMDIAKYTRFDKRLANEKITDMKFCFSKTFEGDKLKKAIYLAKFIRKRGGYITGKLSKCDFFLEDELQATQIAQLEEMKTRGKAPKVVNEYELCLYLEINIDEYENASLLSLSQLKNM